jgi:lipid-binding SYLF domain-containing protein
MKRFLVVVGLSLSVLASVALAPGVARAQGSVQALVDRSTLTLQDMMEPGASSRAQSMLQQARAVLICPRIFKAGFIFGGSGGECVLVARAANGTWSYPAFFGIGGASFGLQLGLQDSEVVMMVLTNHGLDALLSSHFTFGADASSVVATTGGGISGATTTAAGADIVAFAKSSGVFAGLSLGGTILNSRPTWDQAYYGRVVDARQIVQQMAVSNPGADPLRAMLTRYGTAQAAPPPPAGGYGGTAPPPPGYAPQGAGQPGYVPPAGSAAPVPLEPSGGIQQQTLPPPAR